MNLSLVVLAAGIGSRYGSTKQLEVIGKSGETIMDFAIYDAVDAGFNHLVLIIRRELKPLLDAHFDKRFNDQIKIDYVFQDDFKIEGNDRKKPWGTGHALLCVKNIVNNPFVIINADDFYGSAGFKQMAEAFRSSNDPKEFYINAYYLKNTLSETGYVSRGVCTSDENNYLNSIVETTKIIRREDGSVYDLETEVELDENSLVSMNFWGFTPIIFDAAERYFEDFLDENRMSEKAEFYIPTIVYQMIKENLARVKVMSTKGKWFGVTYKEDKDIVVESIHELIDSGEYPLALGV